MRDPWRLEVVELSMQLAELTYRVTARFPATERFGLVDQMRRASVSVGSCVAEGCGSGTDPGFCRYLQVALGSLLELEYQTRLAARLGLGDPVDARELRVVADRLKPKLVGLKNAVVRRMQSGRGSKMVSGALHKPAVRSTPAPDKRSAP